VALIQGSGLPREVKTELLGVALAVASRRFGHEALRAIFREEIDMLDAEENLLEFLKDVGLLQKWLQNPRVIEPIRAEAAAEGREEGRAETLREMTLSLLNRRFGALPPELVERVKSADVEWCQRLFDQAIVAGSLAELTANLERP
jgi:hypothetical protein